MARLFAPDGSDTFVGDLRVDDGIRDRAMAHEGLQGPGIDSSGRQGVASGMAQHVGMYSEWQLSGLAKPFNQLLGAIDGKRRLALGQEHKVCMRMLAPELPQ